MEIASNKGVIADASTPAGRAGMSESEWREAIKFDSTDTGWVIMSIGMAIGAGGNDSNLLIVFYVQIMPDDFVMQLHR
ncbi:hypothetical protein RZQ46_21360, partial [Escherichia coli]|nr:hypothetical protein [Escherichia coli]MDP4354072.1 hypothetical protein [Escherichia coli]MDP4408575.1 hypothetical protein [Escherichia coli]MDV0687681.1 hypothetical protein [Escherichia coli]MDV1683612.1 hypothetical protein [Escherichia coli]